MNDFSNKLKKKLSSRTIHERNEKKNAAISSNFNAGISFVNERKYRKQTLRYKNRYVIIKRKKSKIIIQFFLCLPRHIQKLCIFEKAVSLMIL